MVSQSIRFLYLIFFLFSVFSCQTYRSLLEEEYLSDAEIFYNDKKYEDAFATFQKAYKINKRSLTQFRIIELLILKKEFDKAKIHLDFLSNYDKKNILVQELVAYWHLAHGDIDIAQEKYENLLVDENTTERERIYVNLAVIYQKKKEIDTSLMYFRRVSQWKNFSLEIINIYIDTLFAYENNMLADNEKEKKQSEEDDSISSQNKQEQKTDIVLDKTTKVQDDEKSDLEVQLYSEYNKIVGVLSDAYINGMISIDDVLAQAEKFYSKEKYNQAFAFYSLVDKKKNDSEKILEKQVSAYLAITNMLLKQQYKTTDELSFSTLLRHLEKGLQIIYVNDANFKNVFKKQLADILKIAPTKIFEQNLLDLYKKYDIQ